MATPETDTRMTLHIQNQRVDEFCTTKSEADDAVKRGLGSDKYVLPWNIWGAAFINGADLWWNTFRINREINPYYIPHPEPIQLPSEQLEEYYDGKKS